MILDTTMENRTPSAEYHGDWEYDALIVGQQAFPTSCFSPNPDLVRAETVGTARVGFSVRCRPQGYIELDLSDEIGRIDVTSNSLDPPFADQHGVVPRLRLIRFT